ncbi:MAG: hypothetical protein KGZ75_15370 [Syntrophomonadaceae bacterium]|nr:hypothetical protein [Syntrophomonadaceae bacterium]
MLKAFKSQLGLAPRITVFIVIGAILLGVGTIYLYQQSNNQPEPPPVTGADIVEEEERIRVLFPRGGETLEIGRTYEIRWENYLREEPLIIALQVTTPEGIAYSRIINKNIPAAAEGVYTWMAISERLDGKYKIEIYSPGAEELTGRSEGYFSITGESLITVNTPQPLEGVGGIMLVPSRTGPPIIKGEITPIRITGKARRIFNEGEFVVMLREVGIVWDEDRDIYVKFAPLARSIARAKTSDWMTGEWTDFEAELAFTAEQVSGKTQFLAMLGFYQMDEKFAERFLYVYEFPVIVGKAPVGMSAY